MSQPQCRQPLTPPPGVSLRRDDRPARIVVSDDVAEVRQTISLLLRRGFTDHQLVLCRDGDETWQEITRQPPDLLLMDYRHPGMPVRTMLHQLSRCSQRFPVLICSAVWDSVNVQSDVVAFQFFPVRLLRKPFMASQLHQQVLACFGLPSQFSHSPSHLCDQWEARLPPLEFMPELKDCIANAADGDTVLRLILIALFDPDQSLRAWTIQGVKQVLSGLRADAWVCGNHIFMRMIPCHEPAQAVVCYVGQIPDEYWSRRTRSFPFSI